MMKIKVVIPNSGMDAPTLRDRERMLSAALSPDTAISVSCIAGGPAEIASHTDEEMAGQWLLEAGREAELEGFDAMVVYCFSDPSIDMLREQLSIPIIGPGEITLAMADMFGERCCVITTTKANISRITGRIRRNGALREHFCKVYALDIPVLELRVDPDATGKRLERICEKAVAEEAIDTVIFGCLGMAAYGERLEKKFGVTVLDPAMIGVAFAELCARLHITGSRLKYQKR